MYHTPLPTAIQITASTILFSHNLTKNILLFLLYSSYPSFCFRDSSSLRYILTIKSPPPNPQKMRKPRMCPESMQKEVQIRNQPKQLGLRLRLKNPSVIRPKLINAQPFRFWRAVFFWQSDPSISTSPTAQINAIIPRQKGEGMTRPQPIIRGTGMTQQPSNTTARIRCDPRAAQVLNLASPNPKSFASQASPYNPWSSKYRQAGMVCLPKYQTSNPTQRKVAPLNKLSVIRMGIILGPPLCEDSYLRCKIFWSAVYRARGQSQREGVYTLWCYCWQSIACVSIRLQSIVTIVTAVFEMEDLDIDDQDIKPLIKLTLLTHTATPLTLRIPYFRSFRPQTLLTPNQTIFIPLFHTLQLSTSKQQAQIDLRPLIEDLNHQHYITVQTYLKDRPAVTGGKYALHVEFAQMVVWEHEANQLQVNFKKLGLLPQEAVGDMELRLKVTPCHGCHWIGSSVQGRQAMELNQDMTLYFKSLLDNVTIQVLNGTDKICECKKYVFELLCLDYRVCDLSGDKIRGQLKIKATTYIPIIVID